MEHIFKDRQAVFRSVDCGAGAGCDPVSKAGRLRHRPGVGSRMARCLSTEQMNKDKDNGQ
ncbi:hypothetical protein [Rhizobium sp. CSW-27]|uniref:hypothetical protein n=1 Tax=Rhizobium sp. CSW-27 TaxID=2839985 RepID=UPI001C027E2F|nr:hypothetical protein [Rhizobium sp. CSW-27]MBT9371753.1 hypothetical protein [Rhizobium sp. CSW-27]